MPENRIKLIILDRDETLNYDPGYLNDPSLVRLKPLVIEGLTLLNEFGYQFVVASNQSGIGRGLISEQQLVDVNSRIEALLAEHNIRLAGWFICPHVESDHCDCRKPAPGLVTAILNKFGALPEDCYIIGDRMRDLQAGAPAGIAGILLPGAETLLEPEAPNLVFRAQSLLQAAEFILQRDFDLPLGRKIFSAYTSDRFEQWLNETCRIPRKRIVFTNGCFDILHPGHLQYLKQASTLGDIFIVGLNSDASVSRLKGPSRPINTFDDRALMLANLPFIDAVVQFDEDTPEALLSFLKPAVHTKGGDYIATQLPEYGTVIRGGGRVVILPLRKGYSTSNIVRKINRDAG